MNDFELQSKLKSIPVPARTEEYWENFPARVRLRLHPAFAERRQNVSWPRLAWTGGLAFACVIFALGISPVFQTAFKDERVFQRELAQLPNHLRVFMADEHGMHYLIADQQ